MGAMVLYFCICFLIAGLTFFLHLGASAQVLVLLMGLAVFPIQKFIDRAKIADLGFRRCAWKHVLQGAILPVAILGAVVMGDFLLKTARFRPLGEIKNPFRGGLPMASVWELVALWAVLGLILFLLEFVTEELMFRGYLLGKLAITKPAGALWVSCLVFSLWHLPIIVWEIGLNPLRTPLYLINMFLLGGILGVLFLNSQSLIPVALFHALWNTLEYNVFGFANQTGILRGISRVVFDAEEGVIGTIVLAVVFWLMYRNRRPGRALTREECQSREAVPVSTA